jgi:autotransporter-associated beta strand protein
MSGSADKTISAGSGVTINFNGATFDTGSPGSGIRDLGVSGDGNTVFNAAIVSTNSSTVNATRVLKQGAGTMTLNGANTYLGSTVISSGSLELGSSGSLRFFAGASGSNNAVSGAGEAVIGGTFNIDLSAASTNSGSSWTLVSVASRSYVGSFNVAGFTNSGGTWSRGTNGVTYQFSQSTGLLSVASSAPVSAYNSWLTNYPSLANTNGDADPDGDGHTNLHEFLFGGNPNQGQGGLFHASQQQGGLVLTFLWLESSGAYDVLTTSNLVSGPWQTEQIVPSEAIDQSAVPAGYKRYQVTIPAPNGSRFYRLRGEISD